MKLSYGREKIDLQIGECLTSLHSRYIKGYYAKNFDEACVKILDLIPAESVVGIGDSTTIKQIGIPRLLKEKGIKVLDAFDPKDSQENRRKIVKEATISDVFLTGTNALTRDGRIVNVDASGNRVAGIFWGHPVSIVVVGRNKIVKDLEEALHRIRNIIAPYHIRTRMVELGGRIFKTPCVETGECNDCRSTDRACNIFTIIEGKPFHTDLNVVIVNEDLGLGWDPSWPEERIIRIMENYKKFVWVPMRISH